MPIPERIKNAPELRLGLQLFMSAFLELSSSRATGFGLGPIPWDVVYTYCVRTEMDEEQTEDTLYHVQALDSVYLEWYAARQK